MTRLFDLYNKQVKKSLMEEFQYKNIHEVPKVTKIIVNAGVGRAVANSKFMTEAIEAIKQITGQAPVVTKARKSISGFKIREGMDIGVSVTLRGEKMYEFMDRLVSIALPRVRDFRGLKPAAFDGKGNYSLGMKEHGFFPEISFEDATQPISLQVNIATTAKNDEEGRALLVALGFPFRS
jgi:large subunit ribosomal protein L5